MSAKDKPGVIKTSKGPQPSAKFLEACVYSIAIPFG